MQLLDTRVLIVLAACGLFALAETAGATPYATPPECCVVFGPSDEIPEPKQVPGKTFSDRLDRDLSGAPTPEQNIIWDGTGGTGLGLNYNTAVGGIREQEVDALAARFDALYTEVTENRSALIFSVDGHPDIHQEATDGTPGVWADDSTIDGMNPIRDLDGLEVWGAEGPSPSADDAHRFSLEGDPGVPGGPRVSIWEYDPFANTASIVYTVFDIGTAIGLDDSLWEQLDVDAMMGFQSSVLFSIDEILDPASGGQIFDGGEIFVWDGTPGVGAADFLKHGGHTWDTAFDVANTFDLPSENVNALESVAVPEPTLLVLLGIGFATIASRRMR